MSDIREHAPTDEESRLLHMAQSSALRTSERHPYLPCSIFEARQFKPQAWVMDAVRLAYSAGKRDGAEDAKASMRSALGVAK